MADAFTSGLSAVEPISVRDAASLLGSAPPPPEAAEPQEPQDIQAPEPPVDDDAAPEPDDEREERDAAAADEQPPGENDEEAEEQDDPAESEEDDLPPIDPPRSWTKEDRELFKGLPRETQERLADRERSRETDFRRRQDELTERLKSYETGASEAQKAREQYQKGIEQLAAQAASFVNSEFSDVQSWDDVAKMQEDDPIRFQRWQLATSRATQLQQEQQRLANEGRREAEANFQNYVRSEMAKFAEAEPEFADPEKGPKLQREVRSMLLDDYAISAEELDRAWSGQPVSIHDHRFQRVIMDALRFKQAKSKAANVKPKSPKPKSPPPQKPGTPPAKGEVQNRALDRANQELTRTGDRAAALRLMKAKRAS